MPKKRWVVGIVAAFIVLGSIGLWATQHIAPPPTGYSSVAESVRFYPACGAGPLVYEGDTWHPISRPDWTTPSPKALGPRVVAASGGRGVSTSVRTVSAPPGPGDDVGSLYVYPHGIAYWLSDSGGFDQWFTLVPHAYNKVC